MIRLLVFIQQLIHIYELILLVAVVMSWLFASGKISRYDQRLAGVMQALDALTEPALRRIRPWLPKTGPLDLAPMALFLVCIFVDTVVIGNMIEALA